MIIQKGILCKGHSDRNVDLREASGNLFLKVYYGKIVESITYHLRIVESETCEQQYNRRIVERKAKERATVENGRARGQKKEGLLLVNLRWYFLFALPPKKNTKENA